ncbi:hypothetical protein [uncultured Massilia sp.]|uniref:hypothetical protein n=1 Tax=uncultured Massilia sp. TaxID=169973 RepID=UPI0025E0BCC1|nr:hypothetical protein [uncultured Massilia sp.]
MKTWRYVMAAAMALQTLAPAAHAARASATFDVTFRVQESCAIRTAPPADAAAGQARSVPSARDAEVRCQYRTPYQVQDGAAAPTSATAPHRTEPARDADAPAALTVWF